MNKKAKSLLAVGLAAVIALSATACGGGNNDSKQENTDYNSMSLEDLTAAAKEEGKVNSVGIKIDENVKLRVDTLFRSYHLYSSGEPVYLYVPKHDCLPVPDAVEAAGANI